jgi:hypothetical protein
VKKPCRQGRRNAGRGRPNATIAESRSRRSAIAFMARRIATRSAS